MDKFKLQECKNVLNELSNSEQLKIIYMWVKQKHIGLSEFIELVKLR